MSREKDKVNNPFAAGMKKIAPTIHWQRIEVWTSKGVPDINFCLNGKEHWFEAKWVPSKKGVKFSHELTMEQCAWHLARTKAGGSSWVIARRVDEWKIWPGSVARWVRDHSWDAAGVSLTLDSTPTRWSDVIELIQENRHHDGNPHSLNR